MLMCALGVRSGRHTVGDFVLINAMMIQLYQPLNFMGMVYREIKQAVIDIEKMFEVLSRKPEIEDAPGCEAAGGQRGRACASRTCAFPTRRNARSSKV